MVIDGQFSVEEEQTLSSLDHREIINDFTPGKNEIKNHFYNIFPHYSIILTHAYKIKKNSLSAEKRFHTFM